MAWREYFIYGINFSSITAGDGTLFTRDIIRMDSDSDFELQKIVAIATSRNLRIRIIDDSTGRFLIKQSASLRDMAGGSILTPFILPRPFQILAGSTLTIEVADSSGKSNSLRLYFHGAKIRPGDPPWGVYDNVTKRIVMKKYKAVLPFIYNTGVQTVSGSLSTYTRIEVDNDAHFLIQKITGFSSQAILLDFKDMPRDISWQNIAIHHEAILGSGDFPNILFANRFIPRGSVISINVQNLSSSQATFEINLIGVKLYE